MLPLSWLWQASWLIRQRKEGLYDTLIDLGQLYGLMRTIDDELQLYQEALDEVCGDIVHASTPQLEMRLS